jgi:hypothetical protein
MEELSASIGRRNARVLTGHRFDAVQTTSIATDRKLHGGKPIQRTDKQNGQNKASAIEKPIDGPWYFMSSNSGSSLMRQSVHQRSDQTRT